MSVSLSNTVIKPRQQQFAIVTVVASIISIIAWFLPWFNLQVANVVRSGVSLDSPYHLATSDSEAGLVWLPFFISLILIGIGVSLLLRPATLLLLVFHSFLVANLFFFSYQIMGDMAVFEVWSGNAYSGAHILMQLGFVVAVIGGLGALVSTIGLWSNGAQQ